MPSHGSGCINLRPSCWPSLMPAIVFDMGAKVGFNMYLLDIGGGFPGPEDAKLKFDHQCNQPSSGQVFSIRLGSDTHS